MPDTPTCAYVIGWDTPNRRARLCGRTDGVRHLPSPVGPPVPICADHAVYSERPVSEWA